jgi:hypothetical protein
VVVLEKEMEEWWLWFMVILLLGFRVEELMAKDKA